MQQELWNVRELRRTIRRAFRLVAWGPKSGTADLRCGLLAVGLSVLVGLGCSVDASNLNVLHQDAAAVPQDAKADAVVADSALSSRDSAPRVVDAPDPDVVANRDAAWDGGLASDLLPSANDGSSQPVPDGAPVADAVPSIEVGAPEVAVLGDAADSALAAPDAPPLTNLAPSGTAYRWYNKDATSNSNRVAEPKLNDNSVADDVKLSEGVFLETQNAYEAAGVILPRASNITSVVFVNGASRPAAWGDLDGNFAGDFHLQLSTDGSTWSDARGWTLNPAYPNDASASNRAFVFSGSAAGILGVRVTGLVNPDFFKSAYVEAREVEVWGQSGAQ